MIDFTILGTSATMPLPERALSSAMLSCSGRSILFDCGEGTQSAARRCSVSFMKTDLIALTHYHGDHYFGLPGLLQSMGCLGRTDPLWIIGPGNADKQLAPVFAMAGPLPFSINTLSATDETIQLSEFLPSWHKDAFLTSFSTNHRIKSCGYRFDLKRPGKFDAEKAEALGIPCAMRGILCRGGNITLPDGRIIMPQDVIGCERRGLSLVFSGDTAPCEALEQAANDADILVCDATYPDDSYASQAETYGHCTFTQAAAIARKAECKELWLTHFSQLIEEPEDFLPAAKDIFPGTVCCKDGFKSTLRFPND